MGLEGRVVRLLIGGLAAILAALGLSWFLANFELQTQKVEAGFSNAARRNPYLAAERFLLALGRDARSIAGRELLRDLPSTHDILIVRGVGVLNDERRAALHRWVSQGGHLILDAGVSREGDNLKGDDLLVTYGARLLKVDPPPPPGAEAIAAVDFDGYPEPVEVGFPAHYRLEDTRELADGAVAAGDADRLLQFEVDDGLLTIIADGRFLTNGEIDRHDHALFLALLADPGDDGKVWLLYDSAYRWIGSLLWQEAPLALVSACCLLSLFLWSAGGRLGPLLPGPGRGSRNLLEHLEASAGFLSRHGLDDRLAATTRTRIERAWLGRYPALRKLDPEERAAEIARRAGLPRDEVGQALYPMIAGRGDPVVDSARLQQLWNALSARGSPGDRTNRSRPAHPSRRPPVGP